MYALTENNRHEIGIQHPVRQGSLLRDESAAVLREVNLRPVRRLRWDKGQRLGDRAPMYAGTARRHTCESLRLLIVLGIG